MATGPEHYTEAEQHLAYAMSGGLGMETDFHLGAALVHATLAQAAATALNDADGGTSPDDYRAWRRVASVELATEHRDPEATGTEADTEAYVEAYVEVADAERDVLRDEYVNAERTTLAEQLRARGAEQAAQDAETDAFHAQRRADEAEANGEYVDYAEAEAVREIRELMDLDAAGVESWEQL